MPSARLPNISGFPAAHDHGISGYVLFPGYALFSKSQGFGNKAQPIWERHFLKDILNKNLGQLTSLLVSTVKRAGQAQIPLTV